MGSPKDDDASSRGEKRKRNEEQDTAPPRDNDRISKVLKMDDDPQSASPFEKNSFPEASCVSASQEGDGSDKKLVCSINECSDPSNNAVECGEEQQTRPDTLEYGEVDDQEMNDGLDDEDVGSEDSPSEEDESEEEEENNSDPDEVDPDSDFEPKTINDYKHDLRCLRIEKGVLEKQLKIANDTALSNEKCFQRRLHKMREVSETQLSCLKRDVLSLKVDFGTARSAGHALEEYIADAKEYADNILSTIQKDEKVSKSDCRALRCKFDLMDTELATLDDLFGDGEDEMDNMVEKIETLQEKII